MASIRFTANIQRHVACPPLEVDGATLGAVFDAYFAVHPAARGYVLDDQGRLRAHMAVFIDGRQIEDRTGLGDPVGAASVVGVVQALSGGEES
jgi:sulfur-carrier protein